MKRWTAKGAVARSKKNIDAAIEKLRLVALEWGDVDEGIVYEVEDFIRDAEKLRDDIEANIAERLAAGEHIGI